MNKDSETIVKIVSESKTFKDLLESWFVSQLNRVNSGIYGTGAQQKMSAFDILEKERKAYEKSFAEEMLVKLTPRKQLPLLIGKIEDKNFLQLLEKRLRGEDKIEEQE